MADIKVKIKEIRMQKGLTCQQVADKSGLSKVEVNRIENGKRDPTLKNLFRISEALDVRFEEVYEIILE